MSTEEFSSLRPNSKSTANQASISWAPDLVPYESHPAYQEMVSSPPISRRMIALAQFSKSLVPLLIKRLIRYELIPLRLRKPANAGERIQFFLRSAANAIGLRNKRPAVQLNNQLTATFRKDGCAVVVIPAKIFSDLEAKAKSQFDELEGRRAAKKAGSERAFEESRAAVDPRISGNELFEAIASVLEQAGIMGAASEYLGREAELVDINPQINDKTDGFWRNIFPDLKLSKIPKSAYFHRDASGGDLKAIIYFTDVGPSNGPFTYVLNSNNLHVSRADDLICEANDHNGNSGTEPEARSRFASLPKKLRQKCSFGNDLDDDSKLAAWIKNNSWSIEGAKGSIVLFDTKGVHRGGMVEDGQRRVITCVIG